VKPNTLIGLDFDGTLSPIVPLPDGAYMTQSMSKTLNALIGMSKVAIISGRSVDDILHRIPVRPSYVLGNHGIEGLPGTRDLCLHANRLTDDWVRQLRAANGVEAACRGVVVEDKTFSLAIHYRLCIDRTHARQQIEERVVALNPKPRIIHGHCVLNLLHPDAPDKGVAFDSLMALSGCDNAVFIGDDETDELVFRGAPEGWLTVRVGYAAGSAARFFLHQQMEVSLLLEKMAARLRLKGVPQSARQARES